MATDRSIWSKNIISMDIGQKSSRLIFKLLFRRSSVKIQIWTKYFIRSITIKYNLTITSFSYLSTNHPISNWSSNWCNIIRLYCPNNFRNSIVKILRSNLDLCMIWTDMLCYYFSILKVWWTFKTNWECF